LYRPIGAIGVEAIGNYLQPFAVCLFSVAKARCLYRSGKNTCIGFKVGARVRPGGVVVRALDLRLRRSRVQLPAVALSGSNLGQVVHTHVPLSPSSIIWYQSKGSGALTTAGKVTVGLTSHWPCVFVTDFSRLSSIHGLTRPNEGM